MADTAQQAPQQQTPNPQPIQRPHRQRRVGSLTAGAALILTGLAIGASLLWPSFDLTMVFRLCPLILIFLGIEVVASNFAGSDVQIKYDFLSFFLSIVLVFSALGLSTIPYFVTYFGPEKHTAEQRLSKELEDKVYTALKDDDTVSDCTSTVTLADWRRPREVTLDELSGADSADISIDLRGPYADAASFATACSVLRDKLLAAGLKPDNLYFNWSETDESENIAASAHLDLTGSFALNETAAELTQRVDFYPGETPQPASTQAPSPEATALPDAA